MTNRIKKYVAAATLAVSLGGGGTLIAANATNMIASTADAGMPGWNPPPCGTKTNPCTLSR